MEISYADVCEKIREIEIKYDIRHSDGTPRLVYVDLYNNNIDGDFDSSELRIIADAMDELTEWYKSHNLT